jgi:diketogulonate reductase-like aldo/keto reductase
LKALELGYRSIDTAAGYANEKGVGKAIRESGLKREEIFVTTKLANSKQGYDETLKAFDRSMSDLGLDYLDLYLIHWPLPMFGKAADTWKAFEKLYSEKRIRAIGVCNFEPAQLEDLFKTAAVKPAVNQIELHPRLTQKPLLSFCRKNKIAVEAWSPLMSGGDVLKDKNILGLADKYGKTPAQIILRWDIQNGVIVIPKSVHADRIAGNMDIFDFELDDEDMELIDSLDKGFRTGPNPYTFDKLF